MKKIQRGHNRENLIALSEYYPSILNIKYLKYSYDFSLKSLFTEAWKKSTRTSPKKAFIHFFNNYDKTLYCTFLLATTIHTVMKIEVYRQITLLV